MKKNCLICEKLIIKPSYYSKKTWDKALYCSVSCRAKSQIGVKKSLKYNYSKKCRECNQDFFCKIKLSITQWSIQKFCSKKCSNVNEEKRDKVRKIILALGNKPPIHWGADNSNWKGDNVGYDALHNWVSRQLGKPNTCEHCKKSGLSGQWIQWANKSGNYLRNITDWIRLCAKCHSAYDRYLIPRCP